MVLPAAMLGGFFIPFKFCYMVKKDLGFTVEVFASDGEMPGADQQLLQEARKVTDLAYAPYSNFHVGAAALLSNGKIITGTNQENASYPVGICAERVLLGSAATLYPGVAIESMAISYDNLNGQSNHPISPCGMCRQALAEYEDRVGKSMRLILSGSTGEVYVIPQAQQLLPLRFTSNDMK